MGSIPSCDIINKTGGPLIQKKEIKKKRIYCTALMHVLLTAHPQARNKVLVQCFTSKTKIKTKKKTKKQTLKLNVLVYSKILEGHLANLLFFSGLSLSV